MRSSAPALALNIYECQEDDSDIWNLAKKKLDQLIHALADLVNGVLGSFTDNIVSAGAILMLEISPSTTRGHLLDQCKIWLEGYIIPGKQSDLIDSRPWVAFIFLSNNIRPAHASAHQGARKEAYIIRHLPAVHGAHHINNRASLLEKLAKMFAVPVAIS
ncbi:hypothetical protein DPSP01_012434 [Paraphaeosphaeria sporulosa]